jgi:hypothetical protein
MKMVGNMGKIYFTPVGKIGLHCTEFHTTCNLSMALCWDFYTEFNPNGLKKYGKYQHKFIHILDRNMAVTRLTVMK